MHRVEQRRRRRWGRTGRRPAQRPGAAGVLHACKLLDILPVDLLGRDQAGGRQRRRGVVGAAEPGVNGPHAGLGGVVAAGDDVPDRPGVVGDGVPERADDGQPIGPGRQPREGAAEGHAGDRRGEFAGGAADLRRGVQLRVEGLDVARPAGQEQQDHRLVAQGRLGARRRRGGLRPEQVGQAQAAQAQRPDPEEVAAGGVAGVAPAIGPFQGQHGWLLGASRDRARPSGSDRGERRRPGLTLAGIAAHVDGPRLHGLDRIGSDRCGAWRNRPGVATVGGVGPAEPGPPRRPWTGGILA